MDWSNWFLRMRRLDPLGLIALRSYVEQTDAPGGMQEARYESGLDNSPMYDCSTDDGSSCEYFNKTTGFMELYDVGMNAMFVQEAFALAKLARIIGREEEADELIRRGREFEQSIKDNLWDENQGIYANYFPHNGTHSDRISPTSFYPMMLGSSTEEDDRRASMMIENWLLNSTRFCIRLADDVGGDENDECYWGLPSISYDDPAYPALGYWRGFIWGPMAQLTHWSMQNFDHIDNVQSARKALTRQMRDLFLDQWNKHAHVCENYLPHKFGTEVDGKIWPDECTGTTFYHWGALTGLIFLEETS